MARPLREINWDVVEKLIECGCSGIEIAGKFKIDTDTFYRRFMRQYDCRFADYSAIGESGGKADLRAMIYAKAISNKAPGNAQLLMFLAKCVLGMREPEIAQQQAANQQQIDQTHRIMELEHQIAELRDKYEKYNA